MKILFIPYAGGVVPHLIPLRCLESKIEGPEYKTAYLLPGDQHRLAKVVNLNVLDVDHDKGRGGFQSESLAYQKFKPDVVVDDASLSTFFVRGYHENINFRGRSHRQCICLPASQSR